MPVNRDLSEQDLLERYTCHQDRKSLDTLLTRHYPAIYRVILNLVHHEADASDLAQATFTRALESAGSYRGRAHGPGRFRRWLVAIAVNEVRQHWRRRKTQPRTDPLFDVYRESVPDQAEEAGRREFEQALEQALESFPKRLKVPLVLHYWERMSFAEIAETLGLAKSTVQSRCERGVGRLRRFFQRKGFGALVMLLPTMFPDVASAAAKTTSASTVWSLLTRPAGLLLATGGGALLVWAGISVFWDDTPESLGRSVAHESPAEDNTDKLTGVTGRTGRAGHTTDPDRTLIATAGSAEPDAAGSKPREQVNSTGGGVIVGRLVRMPEAEPVAGAEVKLGLAYHHKNGYVGPDHPSAFVNTYLTDEEGRFVCHSLPLTKAYDIYLRKPTAGYRAVKGIGFAEGRSRVDLGVIITTAGYPLTGTVVDTRGKPLAGVQIAVGDYRQAVALVAFRFPASPLRGSLARTDTGGRFRCESLSPGYHRLLARKDGLAPTVLPEVQVRQDGSSEELRIVMQPAARLTGRVIDERGGPVAGAAVSVRADEVAILGEHGFSSNRPLGSSRTGQDGGFAFTNLPADVRFAVDVDATGFSPEYRAGVVAGTGPLRITLRPSQGRRNGPHTIRGRLHVARGTDEDLLQRTRHLQVQLAPVGQDTFERRVDLAEDGSFEIEQVAAGRYDLSIQVPGFLRKTVPARVDGDVDLGRIELQRGVTLFGYVTDKQTGRPILGATVTWYDNLRAHTNAMGYYELTGLEPSNHTRIGALTVSASTYRRISPALRTPEGVQRVQKDFQLEPAASGIAVRGRVVDGQRRPVAGALVQLDIVRDSAWTQVGIRTDTDGGFVLGALSANAIPPRSQVLVTHPSFAPCQVPYRPGPRTYVMSRGHSLTGVVQDQRGRPVAGARVAAFPLQGGVTDKIPDLYGQGPMCTVLADDQGRFQIDHLNAGKIWLLPFHRGMRVPANPDLLGYLVDPARPGSSVQLVLERGQQLTGRVIDEDGRPLAGMLVFAVGVRSGGTHTDAAGGFRFDAVFVPTVDLRLQADHHVAELKSVAAGSTEVTMVAHRCGSVVGILVGDRDGRPVTQAKIVCTVEGVADSLTAVTDALGRFVLGKVPEGRATLRVDGKDLTTCDVAFRQQSDVGTVRCRKQ